MNFYVSFLKISHWKLWQTILSMCGNWQVFHPSVNTFYFYCNLFCYSKLLTDLFFIYSFTFCCVLLLLICCHYKKKSYFSSSCKWPLDSCSALFAQRKAMRLKEWRTFRDKWNYTLYSNIEIAHNTFSSKK